MEGILIIGYLILCILTAYYIGNNDRMGFGYSFLFSLLLTPLVCILISYFTDKLRPNITFKNLGLIMFYISGISCLLLVLSISSELKSNNNKRYLNDSIRVKSSYYKGQIAKVLERRGGILAELTTGKFVAIHDSALYKNYVLAPEIKSSTEKIRLFERDLNQVEELIKDDIRKKRNSSVNINRYNKMLEEHNLEVKNINTLLRAEDAKYTSYKIERPSWLYFKSNRSTLWMLYILLTISIFSRFLYDAGRRAI